MAKGPFPSEILCRLRRNIRTNFIQPKSTLTCNRYVHTQRCSKFWGKIKTHTWKRIPVLWAYSVVEEIIQTRYTHQWVKRCHETQFMNIWLSFMVNENTTFITGVQRHEGVRVRGGPAEGGAWEQWRLRASFKHQRLPRSAVLKPWDLGTHHTYKNYWGSQRTCVYVDYSWYLLY